MRQISEAAWECADPGMQFDTTINRWHTAPNTGPHQRQQPVLEYMHLDNSACNLASINLLKYLGENDGTFDVEAFKHTVEVMFTAQEILVGNADYPTERSPRRAGSSASSGSGTRTSAPCSWRRPALRLRRRAGRGRRRSPR